MYYSVETGGPDFLLQRIWVWCCLDYLLKDAAVARTIFSYAHIFVYLTDLADKSL